MNIFQRMGIRIGKWFDKLKRDRDRVDEMVNRHEVMKDEQKNSPAGFEATEVHRKSPAFS